MILRYVTYASFAGDARVLDHRCLNALRETYLALGVPGPSVATRVPKMRETAIAIAHDRNAITQGDCSAILAELASYFDRAAVAAPDSQGRFLSSSELYSRFWSLSSGCRCSR
jgi:phycocyanin beta chain